MAAVMKPFDEGDVLFKVERALDMIMGLHEGPLT